mgnify:FL=1
MAVIGAVSPLLNVVVDRRVTASVAMSPQTPAGLASSSFSKVFGPVLHLTGTNDTSPVDPTLTPESRLLPYAYLVQYQSPASDQVLVNFAGARHADFGFPTIAGMGDRIVSVGVAFLDATLRNDTAAREWLPSATTAAWVNATPAAYSVRIVSNAVPQTAETSTASGSVAPTPGSAQTPPTASPVTETPFPGYPRRPLSHHHHPPARRENRCLPTR